MQRFLAAALVLGSTVPCALAHPGHGSAANQDGILHFVLSPLHVVPWLLLAIAGSLLAFQRHTARKTQNHRQHAVAKKQRGNDAGR